MPDSKRPKPRAAKLVALVNILEAHAGPVTAAALADALKVSERTIYRYVSELVAQGELIGGEAGYGYVIRPAPGSQPIVLTEEEAEAVLFGLKAAETRSQGRFADTIRATFVKIQEAAPTSTKGTFRSADPTSPATQDPQRLPVDLEPYLKAMRSNSRMFVQAKTNTGDFAGSVCPFAFWILSEGIDLLAWIEKERRFVELPLLQIIRVETTGGQSPHRRERLFEAWSSRKNFD